LSRRRAEQLVGDDRLVVADPEIVFLSEQAQVYRVPQRRDHLVLGDN
jgi:hypothetical protein